MKSLSSIFTTAACAAALFSASTAARAEWITSCGLSVPSLIAAGDSFEFGVTVQVSWYGIGRPVYYPYFYPRPPYTGVFYGTKNGVDDIPTGYTHPGTFNLGYSQLGGYGNPGSPDVAGTYTRYMDVYDSYGIYICTTNAVSTTLLASPPPLH